MGFRSDPFMGKPGVPGIVSLPLTLDLTEEQIRADHYRALRDLKVRKGYISVFPVVVKLKNNEGEFLVYADGSAQYTSYTSGRVSAPFKIK